jgi:hypothetical protein
VTNPFFDLSLLNESLDSLGNTDITIKVAGVATVLPGIFYAPDSPQTMGGFGFPEVLPRASLTASLFYQTFAKEGDSVVVDGIEYTISQPPNTDGGGRVLLTLSKAVSNL